MSTHPPDYCRKSLVWPTRHFKLMDLNTTMSAFPRTLILSSVPARTSLSKEAKPLRGFKTELQILSYFSLQDMEPPTPTPTPCMG